MEMGQHHEIQCQCNVGSVRPGSHQQGARGTRECGHVSTVLEPRVWITQSPNEKGAVGLFRRNSCTSQMTARDIQGH